MKEEQGERMSWSEEEVTRRQERSFWRRKWKTIDVIKVSVYIFVHSLCLLAPFHYNGGALKVAVAIFAVEVFGITVSYHRNLSHRSFKLPKWLEYPFAYCGFLALQGDPMDWVSVHRFHHKFTDTKRDPHSPVGGFWFSYILWLFDAAHVKHQCGRRSNVEDLKRQWFYRFLQRIGKFHVVAYGVVLYLWGGLPFLTWGMGVATAVQYHVFSLVNSACHIWGTRVWNSSDTSRNLWWLCILSFGESWHNNHHAFETSARHGFEWWQIDIAWCIIRSLQAVGLATDVKLPSQPQLRRMALLH